MNLLNTSFKAISAMLLTLTFTSSALAATTTLTFDEFPDQTEVTTQYQDRGVTASGVYAIHQFSSPWPAHSGTNLAYAPSGQMSFNLNQTVIGDVQSASAYISGTSIVGIYAYDSNGALVGQSLTPGASDNQFVTVVSSGNPIASIVIHDSGSNFAIDTLSFESADALVCSDVIASVYNQVNALGNQDFKSSPPTRKKTLLAEIQKLKSMMDTDASISKMRTQWTKIRKLIVEGVKESSLKTELLETMDELLVMIDGNQC